MAGPSRDDENPGVFACGTWAVEGVLPLLYAVLVLVSVANIFNLGADIGAMGAATQLVPPGKTGLFIVIFGMGSLAGVMFVPYST